MISDLVAVAFVAGLGWGLIVGAVLTTVVWSWVLRDEDGRLK